MWCYEVCVRETERESDCRWFGMLNGSVYLFDVRVYEHDAESQRCPQRRAILGKG